MKYQVDATFERYKISLLSAGYTLIYGVDCQTSFFLYYIVHNAFIDDDLEVKIYMDVLYGFGRGPKAN